MQVKICGHRHLADARESARLGADLIGVIVEVPVDTRRKVSRGRAREIVRSIKPPAQGVMVIMPGTVDEAVELYEAVKPSFIQLHGAESVAFVEELKSAVPCSIIKTVHVRSEDSIKHANSYANADAILLDTASEKAGGSGIIHNWEISRKIVEQLKVPIFLAGGLTPENVRSAVDAVGPYGVDVASGVEDLDGKKDFRKIKEFIRKAKGLKV